MTIAIRSELENKSSVSLPFYRSTPGFSLVEFMLCLLILLVVAGSVFGILNQTQRTAGYQLEVQGVLEGTRYSMMTIERLLQQAGNDPLGVGFPGLSELTPTHVHVRADLTGSAGAGNPADADKGDPDGDTMDSGEDVTINFDAGAGTIQINGQPIASNISSLSMEYFDKNGGAAVSGDQVTRIRITLAGRSPTADPQTHKTFAIQIVSDVQLLRRAK